MTVFKLTCLPIAAHLLAFGCSGCEGKHPEGVLNSSLLSLLFFFFLNYERKVLKLVLYNKIFGGFCICLIVGK